MLWELFAPAAEQAPNTAAVFAKGAFQWGAAPPRTQPAPTACSQQPCAVYQLRSLSSICNTAVIGVLVVHLN